MEKLEGKTFDIVEDNISKLKEIFPEVVNGENQINFDDLRDILGDYTVDSNEDFYQLTWWGKKEAKIIAKQPITKTLRPIKKDSQNWDTTENIYIEGDNLDALKILLGAYRNSIKMIYIDPPYNTENNDLIYDDNFAESKNEHLERTGQINKSGFLDSNPIIKGKNHTQWLNKIYPRLFIARKLLTNDGIFCISIDEHEIFNLRLICNEIFGENNCIGEIIRKTKTMTGDSGNGFNLQHEYLLIYAKNIKNVKLQGKEKEFKNYSNDDNDPKGDWCSGDPSAKSGGESTFFPIENPYTNKIDYPPNGRYWAFSKNTFDKYVNEGKIKFKKHHGENNRGFIFKRYKCDVKDRFNPVNSLFINNNYLNEKGTGDLKNLFGVSVFDYPKPVDFIKDLIKYCSDDDDIILDFFSGSATTAQAVFKLNHEENSNRKFIIVQIDEKIDHKSEGYKFGFNTIFEIGKERIRRSGDKILEEMGNKDLDIGFKVFKVDESNFIPWNPNLNSEEDIKEAIINTENNLVQGSSELDLIYELLLKLNMDLTTPIEEKIMNNHKIYVIDNGYALICLDSNLDESIADDLLKLKEDLFVEYCQVILRDDALDDNSSINIYENLNSKGVEFRTI